jgi:hypothetical protein
MSIEKKTSKARVILNLLGCGGHKLFTFFAYFIAINFLFICPSDAKPLIGKSEKNVQEKIRPDERKWLEKLFTDIMFRENGIYTLYGSKPMTLIILDHKAEEKMQAWVDEMSEEEKKDLITLKEPYDLPENWEKWEKIKDRFPMSNYFFLKCPRKDDPSLEDVYFVNIQQAAITIQEHYTLFKQHVGEDFNPLKAVFEIGNEQSVFWKKTISNSTLLGILFGYGEKNAHCFRWKYWAEDEDNERMEDFLVSMTSVFANDPKDYVTVSTKNFPLPYFASFSPPGEDEVIHKYEREREKIQKNYKGKDFLAETLRKLTSS